jgi:hypothetical protein
MEAGGSEWDEVILLLRCGKCVGRDEISWLAFESTEPLPDATVFDFPAAS